MKNKTIKKSICIGLAIFVVTNIIVFCCSLLMEKLFLNPVPSSPLLSFMGLIFNIIMFICMPFSRIVIFLFGWYFRSTEYCPFFIYKYAQLIFMMIDLLGWIGLTAFVLNKKCKNGK